jgi:hypothetical protein
MNSLTREILVAAREAPRLYIAPLIWLWNAGRKLARHYRRHKV